MRVYRPIFLAIVAGIVTLTQPQLSLSQQTPVIQSKSETSSEAALEEIIVTAQFQEQDLQRTPIAITAVAAESIEARGMVSVLDVAQAAPNITMTLGNGGAGNANQIYIRGIGQFDSNFAFEPRNAFYVDDVYHATVFGSVFDLLDVERIEVLRGPQGSLFGRNAVGGAVRIFSKQPQGGGDGYAQATVGSIDRVDVKGALDVTVVPDSLFLRLSAGRQERDGHVDRLNFACVNPALAGNLPSAGPSDDCHVGTLGGIELYDTRAALRWVINDRIETTLAVDYLNDDREPPAETILALSTVNERVNAPNGLGVWLTFFGMPFYGLIPNQALLEALRPADNYTSYAIFGNPGLVNPLRGMVNPPLNTLDAYGISNTFDWRISNSINLKSITAYRAYDGDTGASAMALPLTEIQVSSSHRQFSQELRLSGSAFGERLDWTLGAFYLDTSNRFRGRVQTEGFALFIPGPNISVPFVLDFLSDDRSTLENISVFAHTVWRAGERLNVTAGVRYTDETKGYRYFRQNIGQPPNNTAAAPDTNVTEFNPRIAIDYAWTPGLITYASYSTGFTAGGFNPRPFTPADAALSFGTETATAYEVGVKSEWFNHRLRLNAAAYFTRFDGIQLQVPGCPVGCRSTSPFYYDNAGDAEVQGLEIEIQARPIPPLLVTAYTGSTDFEFVEVRPGTGIEPGDANVKTPDWKTGGSLEYQIDLGAWGTLTPRIDVVHHSAAYLNPIATSATLQDAYALVNARMTWDTLDKNWTVAFAVSNLSDELYFDNLRDQRNGFGFVLGQVARPREWAVTVIRRF